VIHESIMPYDSIKSRPGSWMCESSNFLLLMSYIKVCLHHQNACNQNNNGEL